MNNFTKEFGFTKDELVQILCLLGLECDTSPIYKKVQFMIDNYCEHQWFKTSCDGVLTDFECEKCGDIYNNYQ
jgi:hypothetical protein